MSLIEKFKKIFCCLNSGESKIQKNDLLSLQDENIPDNIFLCPECEKIPEILSINTDISRIELECKCCGIFSKSIEEYILNLKNSKFNLKQDYKCKICEQKKDIIIYCKICNDFFCEECNINPEKHSSKHELDVIKFKINKNKCNKHDEKFISYCKNCQQNLCNEDFGVHKTHNKINFNRINKSCRDYRKLINERINNLTKQMRINKLILDRSSKFPNNYFHMKDVINVGKSIENESLRNSNDIDCFFIELNNNSESKKKGKEKLKEAGYHLTENEEFLHLSYFGNIKDDKNKKENNQNENPNGTNEERILLDDKHFESISYIHFTQLNEINISNNSIKNIEPLSKMFLPFLESLNFSFNQIENIEPIANLNCKELKEIILTKNNISDISPFINSVFPKLELLRVENNKIILEGNKDIECIKKIFGKKDDQFIYVPKTEKDFKKYNLKISIKDDKTSMNLIDAEGDENMLKELYLFITLEFTNNIIKLNLMNNKINDPSILCKIRFPELITLDLTLNCIKNLKFLFKMKCRKLKNLYLNENKINNIHPLKNLVEKNQGITPQQKDKKEKEKSNKKESNKMELESLKVIYLNNNYLDLKDIKNKEILKYLEENGIEVDINIDKENKNK